MVLKNYWLLLIWLFVAGGLSLMFETRREELVQGQKCVRWYWFYAIILAAPFVIWATNRPDVFDTGVYRGTFQHMPIGLAQLPEYLPTRQKGKGFVVFEYLIKTFISDSYRTFFFIVALIQMWALVRIYRKYSRNFWFSMFLFIASTDYISWMFNGIRQFLVAALIFTCIPLIVKRRYLLMVIIVLLLSQFHSSALVFLPFIFIINGRAWNLRTVFFLLAVVVAVLFVDRVSGFITDAMQDTSYEGDIAIFLKDDGTNILRVLFYSVPAIMSLVFRQYIDAADDPMINVCANLSIVAAGFYVFSFFTSGILMGSIPIYFSLANYILIPWLITEVFDSGSAVFINTIFVAVYSFFFYYQMGPTWRLL